MKTVYAYLCQHDRFTLGLITALTAAAWAAYFTPVDYAAIGRLGFLVCFGAVTALSGVSPRGVIRLSMPAKHESEHVC